MRRTLRIFAVIAVLWIAYLAWPIFALYSLANAVEAHNARAVAEQVDFRAVRRSLTAQIFQTYLRLSGREARLSRFQDIIVSATSSVVDPIVADLMTTDALFEILDVGWPRTVLPDDVPATAGLRRATLGSIWQLYLGSSRGLRTFSVRVPANVAGPKRFRLQFRLSNWRWRLSAIELPDALRVRAAQELIKRIDKR